MLPARVGAREGRAARALPLAVPGRHAHGAPRRRLQAGRVRARRRGGVRQERPHPHVREPGAGEAPSSGSRPF